MKTYLLKRFSMTDKGAFGAMLDENNIPLVLTAERPWVDNKNGISCIPAGTYSFERINSPKHGDCFQAKNVPGRDFIQIHIANTPQELEGCIAVGVTTGKLEGQPAVLASVIGFKLFMDSLKGEDSFSLRIVEV